MDDFDKRTRKAIDTMEGNLSDKATAQHSKIGANIKNLEKYVEEMHNQQIIDYEKLKKVATDKASGIYSNQIDEQVSVKDLESQKKQDLSENDQRHIECSKDYLRLCKEQRRQDEALTQINRILTELIKINLYREGARIDEHHVRLTTKMVKLESIET